MINRDITIKTLTVGELRQQLEGVNPDLPVYIWDDGERFMLQQVDDSWVEEGGWVDLNLGGYV